MNLYILIALIITIIFIITIYIFKTISNTISNTISSTSKNTQESFDTYRNHDIGAFTVYHQDNEKNEKNDSNRPSGNKSGCLNYQCPDLSFDPILKAKYNWQNRDKAGYTVYDKMYNNEAQEKIWGNDNEYSYREFDTWNLDNVYDLKFTVLDNDNLLSTYNKHDMDDPKKVQIMYNGQIITLAQKQY